MSVAHDRGPTTGARARGRPRRARARPRRGRRRPRVAPRCCPASWPPLLALLGLLAAVGARLPVRREPTYAPAVAGRRLGRRCATSSPTAGCRRRCGPASTRGGLGFLIALAVGTPLGLLIARVQVVRRGIGPLVVRPAEPAVGGLGAGRDHLLRHRQRPRSSPSSCWARSPSIANGMVSRHRPGAAAVPPGRHGARRPRADAWRGYVLLPAALPGYVGGLRQGWAFSWRSLMAAELIVNSPRARRGARASCSTRARLLSDMTLVFAGILGILVVGIAVELLVFAPARAAGAAPPRARGSALITGRREPLPAPPRPGRPPGPGRRRRRRGGPTRARPARRRRGRRVVAPDVADGFPDVPVAAARVRRRRRRRRLARCWPAPARSTTPSRPPASSAGSGACGPTTPRASAAWVPAVARVDDVVVSVTAGRDPRRAVALRDALALALETGRPAAAPAPAGRRLGGAGRRRAGRPGPADRARPAAARRAPTSSCATGSRPRVEVPDGVEVVEVGKTPGGPSWSQRDIEALLVEQRAARAGASCGSRAATCTSSPAASRRSPPASRPACRSRWCPGVTSALAGPTYAGIPVTARGVTQSFAVVSRAPAARRPRLHRRLGRARPARRHARAAHGGRPAARGLRGARRRRPRPPRRRSPSCRRATLPGQATVVTTLARAAPTAPTCARRPSSSSARSSRAGSSPRDAPCCSASPTARKRPGVAGGRARAAGARRRAAARACGRRRRTSTTPRRRSAAALPALADEGARRRRRRAAAAHARLAQQDRRRRLACRPAGWRTRACGCATAGRSARTRCSSTCWRRGSPRPARGDDDPVRAGRRRRARPGRQRAGRRDRAAAVRGPRAGRSVDIAFASTTRPSVPEALERLRAQGHARVSVARYFLGPGYLPRLVEQQAARSRGSRSSCPRRSASATGWPGCCSGATTRRCGGDIRMNCDVCLYRVPLPGREAAVGARAGAAHPPRRPASARTAEPGLCDPRGSTTRGSAP